MRSRLLTASSSVRGEARQLERRAFLLAAQRLVPSFGIAHEAGVILVPSDELTIRPKLFLGGKRGDFRSLRRTMTVLGEEGLQGGGTFVDVGANLGTTSLAALGLHGFERVLAIEPDPDNARYLRATAALNGFEERMAVFEAAAGERAGRARFARGRADGRGRISGTGSLTATVPDDGDVLDVRVVSIDELVASGELDPSGVRLLWLDVQGHEGFVLRGSTTVLERRVPVVAALRRWRLDRAAGRAPFVEIVREHFSRFVDLRGRPWSPAIRAIGELEARIELGGQTDVLLLP